MGSNGQLTGAPSAQLAVDQFLKAVNAKDLQAMSTVFGTKDGPARETMDRTELEKREVILACYFNNDSYRTLGEMGGSQGHREIKVELRKGNLTRETTFYAIRGPGGRWYIDNMDMPRSATSAEIPEPPRAASRQGSDRVTRNSN
jgi:hypothetical protein